MIPLNVAPQGEELSVKRVSGSPEVKKHLEDLGFVPGQYISVVSELGGNLIVKVKESRIAIDKLMACKILV